MILPLIIVLGVGTLGALVWLVLGTGDRGRQRLASLGAANVTAGESSVSGPSIRGDAVPALTQALQATPLWQDLQVQLIRAGWLLRPSEFIALCTGAGIGVTGLGWLVTKSLAQGLVFGAVCATIPYVMLKGRQQQRLKMLTSQVPDALDMLAGSLRSGCALLRAMQVIRTQMHPPVSEEFGRVVDEVSFGVAVEDALSNMVLRTGSYDLELIVAAIQTQLTVGGNLAEIFDSIGEMIRERVRLMGELQTATAEGRMSAGILLAMPFVMAFLINLISPGYLAPLFKEQLGLVLLGVGAVLMVIGTLVIRKLVDIDI